jgi:outer membrane protein assembly factor BamC
MKDRIAMTFFRLALSAAVILSVAGCSGFGFKTTEYKGAQARAAQPLEVPPELTAPTMDDRYAIPDPRSQTTYSTYSKATANATGTPVVTATAAASAPVLPKIEGVKLERGGDQRWLVVKGDPEKVWPVVREFWVEAGFPLVREEPAVGIMETDWYEDRARIPQDIVRRTIGRVLDGIYSTPRRDKYRTRLEKGSEPGTTEVFVSNRAMEEVYTNTTQDRTIWQPLKADRELEAEMLSRMMVKMGAEATKVATAASTATPGVRGAAPSTGITIPDSRNAVLENAGAGPLVVNDTFDRAWRRVGLALDRVGFTVEDRDRSKGVFFVRYIDPEADVKTGDKGGFLAKLAFWKSAPKASSQPQYRIHVSDAGAAMSQVQVQDAKGTAENSGTGKKILGLLYEQLK